MLLSASVRRLLLILLFFIVSAHSRAQTELLGDALRDYTTASGRLLTHETVAIEWKMDGKIQVELNEGLNNLLENNPALAEHNFSQVIQADPTLWHAYYYRGICNKLLERYREARQDILHVIETHHAVYESYLELGKIDLLEHDLKAAESSFEKGIKVAPEKPMAYYLKANAQLDQNEPKKALKNYGACLLEDSLFYDARIKVGILEMIAKEKPEAALPHLNIVLRSDSLNRHALLFRSILNSKDQKQSLADLDNLVRISPGNVMGLYLRGLLLSELGNYVRSFPDFHKVIEATYADENTFIGKQTWLDKKIDIQNAGAYTVSRVYGLPDDDGAKIKKAYCLLVTGAYANSIATIDGTAIANTEPLCLFLKAVASEHGKKHADAFRYYNQALALDNDILDAHKKRGIYEQELKEWKKSILDFNEVLRLNPETFIVYKIRGVSYFHENMFSKAIDDFSRYLQRDTANKEITGYRGMAYLKDGQSLKASIDFANSGNVEMLEFKKLGKSIDSLLHKGDTLDALTYLNKLTKTVPYFTEGYVLKIKLLVDKNDWNSLEGDVDTAIKYSRTDVSPRDHSYLLTVKGIASGKGKKYEEALDKLSEAIRYDKQNSLAFLERGKILLATGKSSKAITDLKRASSLGRTEADELLTGIHN